MTLLVDNANKYCDAGGTVSVKLSKANRLSKARLEISNTYVEGKNVDYSKFFERFYREDESHNNKNQVMVSDCQWHRPWLNSSKEALAFLIAEIPLHS